MILITAEQRERMLANSRRLCEDDDPMPVVKLFTPDAQATWLLSELDPDDDSIAFGVCDLGVGCPELGYVSLTEIANVRGPLGLPVERDLHFRPDKTISAYAEEARAHSRIIA